jgi:hypothetical protein
MDKSQFPIVCTQAEGDFTPEQARAYCQEMSAIVNRLEPFASITDLTLAVVPQLASRTVLRNFVSENHENSNKYTICAALVIKSSVLKMAVQAVYHLKRTAFPHRAFNTREDALAWVTQKVNDYFCGDSHHMAQPKRAAGERS